MRSPATGRTRCEEHDGNGVTTLASIDQKKKSARPHAAPVSDRTRSETSSIQVGLPRVMIG